MIREICIGVSSLFCKRVSTLTVINSNSTIFPSRNFQLSSVFDNRHYPNNNRRFYKYKKPQEPVRQLYDAFLVLDFESTCKEGFGTLEKQEIIEFPCLWMDGKSLEITSTFHRFVKPKLCEQLDPFCVSLTGINDDTLANQSHFDIVLKDFLDWLKHQKTTNNTKNTVFVTSGDWDFKTMLPLQCQYSDIPVPPEMEKWINVKEEFCNSTGTYPYGLKHMLEILNIESVGRLHSGIDDCVNIANIIRELAERGAVFGSAL